MSTTRHIRRAKTRKQIAKLLNSTPGFIMRAESKGGGVICNGLDQLRTYVVNTAIPNLRKFSYVNNAFELSAVSGVPESEINRKWLILTLNSSLSPYDGRRIAALFNRNSTMGLMNADTGTIYKWAYRSGKHEIVIGPWSTGRYFPNKRGPGFKFV